MSVAAPAISERAAELRREFDRGFAAPPHIESLKDDLLAIRIGAQPFAMRLSEIGGLFADKRVTKVPGSITALRGIAGFRGTLLPVYDLPALLGSPPSTQSLRWLVVAAVEPVAFAFASFEGHLRATRSEIVPRSAQDGPTPYAREYVRAANLMRPILDLLAILATIKSMSGGPLPGEE